MVEGLFNKALSSGEELTELRQLELVAHRLAGSGATFGFPAISEAARTLEERLNELLATEIVGSKDRRELTELVTKLSNWIRIAMGGA